MISTKMYLGKAKRVVLEYCFQHNKIRNILDLKEGGR